MTFTPEQISALSSTLDKKHVSEREQSGRKFSYIEGWWAEAEANRIFGFDGWDSAILELRPVAEYERAVGSSGAKGWGVSYVATVRVRVLMQDGSVVTRDGVGAGHGIDRDLGQAHESATKEAATDAEKRALKTFGNPFGLALYDKTRANVTNGAQAPKDYGPAALADDFQGAEGVKGKSAYAAKKDGTDKRFNELRAEIATLEGLGACTTWANARADEIKEMPESWRKELRGELENQKAFIMEAEAKG